MDCAGPQAGLRMSGKLTSPSAIAALRTRWQGPAFVLAAIFFGAGVWRLRSPAAAKAAVKPQAMAEQLIASGRYSAAAGVLDALLSEPDRAGADLAAFHRLAGRAWYLEAEQTLLREPSVGREIAQHFQNAEKLGGELTPHELVYLGEGYVWQGDAERAAAAFRKALSGDGGLGGADAIRRQIVEWIESGAVAAEGDEERELLDGILRDDRAGSGNVAWALERRVEALIASGATEEAARIVKQFRPRLAGSPNRDLASYLEAACLASAGEDEAAEAILRNLRATWAPRDVLWGKVTRLLGELNTRAGRADVGLGYFDELNKAFRSGPVYEAGLMGRAESLVRLERYGEAADTLDEVVGLIEGGHASAAMDRTSVLAFLQTSARLLEGRELAGHAAEALRYFEMSARLLSPEDRAESAFVFERIGDLHAGLSREARGAGFAMDGAVHADAAAEAYLELARVDLGDEARATRALWNASEQFEQAGEGEREVSVLEEIIASYPKHPIVAAAFERLGKAQRGLKNTDGAIGAYERLLREQPHTVEATRAVVPLAECLIAKGVSGRAEAAALLMRFVDQPPGSEALVTPQAPEYREALMLLGETLADDGEHDEAIARIEKTLGLYPEDARVVHLRFRLGGCYRASAAGLKSGAAGVSAEKRRRYGTAATNFGKVVLALAARDEDGLSEVERAELKSAYAQRADCLFEAGRYAEAAAAYAEVLWRYEAEPMAVPAALQIVHCNLRLGRRDEARRGLERVRWLLGKIPAAAFERERAMPGRGYWEELLERFSRSGLVS